MTNTTQQLPCSYCGSPQFLYRGMVRDHNQLESAPQLVVGDRLKRCPGSGQRPATGLLKMVEVKRVKDAIGAYCLDCHQVFSDMAPWHWTKSKWLHENGTESQGKKHRVILVGVDC